MEFEWDDDKATRNLKKHGVAFESAKSFEFETAVYDADDSEGEERLIAFGFIGGRIHGLV